MRFKEALAHIVQTERAEHTENAFYLYSRLSDLCTSFEDREKVRLFYEVDRRLHLIYSVQQEGQTAVPVLKTAYPAVKSVLSAARYSGLVDCVADVVFPSPAQQEQTAVKKSAQKAIVKKAAVQRAPQQQEEPRTLLAPRRNVCGSIITVAVCLAFVVGFICLGLFANWTVWQYVIGLLGGLVLLGIGMYVVALITNIGTLEGYHVAPFILFAVAGANFGLFCAFHAAYKIIFVCFSAYLLLASIITILYAFGDGAGGWIIGSLIAMAAVVVGLAVGLPLL